MSISDRKYMRPDYRPGGKKQGGISFVKRLKFLLYLVKRKVLKR